MPSRIAAHLYCNRHDTFYDRRVVPADLAPHFSTKALYRTLATRDRLLARERALAITVQLDALFRKLRSMPKKKPADALRSYWTII